MLNHEPQCVLSLRMHAVSAMLVAILGVSMPGAPLTAQIDEAAAATSQPSIVADYSSRHFVLHTDLPEAEARATLDRLEATLSRITAYWGRSATDIIECYVVHDTHRWKDSQFPHSFARVLIEGIGGGTYVMRQSVGRRSKHRALVYASSRPGVVEHEAVHAYCSQTFRAAGPDWYKEGMAQLAYYCRDDVPGVKCDLAVIAMLRKGPIRTLDDVLDGGKLTRSMEKSLESMDRRRNRKDAPTTADDMTQWMRDFGPSVAAARENYHWCWSLCHFLSRNPNYADRFRALGGEYLSRKSGAFTRLFGTKREEITFEYRFFLERIDIDYRVDLCRWDWDTAFHDFDGLQAETVSINSARGFQASGMLLDAECHYQVNVAGSWSTTADAAPTTAAGNAGGSGRLMGAILTGYELSEEFDVGNTRTFVAPTAGRLYLRCRDNWSNLADNQGTIDVELQPIDGSATEKVVADGLCS